MKSIPASRRLPMPWEDTFVYPDELISGSACRFSDRMSLS